MKKILLDTDIGGDIDDAVCLAYLLGQPRCNLLGITTVSGEATKRAKLASALCRAADKDIPIYPGVEVPLLTQQMQAEVGQVEALAQWEHETRFPTSEAIWFLRETIRRHPGEVTLLAIGPLTNIALLFSVDPELPSLLKSIVLMCGFFTVSRLTRRPLGPREWNAICDPYAAAIVYGRTVPIHRSVGLDVTRRVSMNAEEVKQRFQSPLLRPVLDFAEVWFREKNRILFHDPLAAVTVFNDDVCSFESGTVEIELSNQRLRGRTRFNRVGEKHEVALDVNPTLFFDEFFGVFEDG